MGELCTDNRFELIAECKNQIIEATNIETAENEMAVIDNILFRFWQMGWLDKILADAVPVVHGTWLYLYKGNYKCSNCGAWYSTDKMPEEAGLSYCPTCGAKMDGGKEN